MRLTNWDALQLAALVQARHARRVHGVEGDHGHAELKRDARIFGVGAACGFIAGAALVARR